MRAHHFSIIGISLISIAGKLQYLQKWAGGGNDAGACQSIDLKNLSKCFGRIAIKHRRLATKGTRGRKKNNNTFRYWVIVARLAAGGGEWWW